MPRAKRSRKSMDVITRYRGQRLPRSRADRSLNRTRYYFGSRWAAFDAHSELAYRGFEVATHDQVVAIYR